MYNAKKSEIIVFKAGHRSPSHVPPITLNGFLLNKVIKIKYLGHIITECLSDDEDIERERRALAVRSNMLLTATHAGLPVVTRLSRLPYFGHSVNRFTREACG